MRENKGVTFGGWTQGIVFILLFVVIFSVVIIGGMNEIHPKNYTVTGLPTDTLQTSFEEFQDSSTNKIKDGDVSFTDLGEILFIDSWRILIGAFEFILEFFFGGWIETIFSLYLNLPGAVVLFLRGLWIISIIFIILSIIFKRST